MFKILAKYILVYIKPSKYFIDIYRVRVIYLSYRAFIVRASYPIVYHVKFNVAGTVGRLDCRVTHPKGW